MYVGIQLIPAYSKKKSVNTDCKYGWEDNEVSKFWYFKVPQTNIINLDESSGNPTDMGDCSYFNLEKCQGTSIRLNETNNKPEKLLGFICTRN